MSKKQVYKQRRASIRALVIMVAVLSAGCSMFQGKMSPYLDRILSGPVTISSEWLEITLPEPLKPAREINEVVLWFAIHYTPDWKNSGVKFSDGSIGTMEVQLVDQNGKIYDLTISGLDETGISYSWHAADGEPINLPPNMLYSKLRIKSNKSIECSKIVWRSYNQQDRK